MDVCVLWMLCVIRYGTLRRADHSSREVLPGVVCQRSWNPDNEETLAHQELLHQGKQIRACYHIDMSSYLVLSLYWKRECSNLYGIWGFSKYRW